MRNRVGMTDTVELASQAEADIARAISGAMREGTDLLKGDWRDQIERAGLGSRLARTVQGRTYPASGDSLDPSTWVFTKAPMIVDAYDRGPVIVPTGASGVRCLAIPTLNVPRRGRHVLTPVEVEAMYDQDLTIRHGRNGNLLAFVDAQGGVASWTRNQGLAYGRRSQASYKPRPHRGRRPIWKLMFILVRNVRVRKRLDLQMLADAAAARWPGLLSNHWLAIPERTARMKGL